MSRDFLTFKRYPKHGYRFIANVSQVVAKRPAVVGPASTAIYFVEADSSGIFSARADRVNFSQDRGS
jgi:hypothetical protein